MSLFACVLCRASALLNDRGVSLGRGPEAKHLKQGNNKICLDFIFKDPGFYVGKGLQAIQ